MLGEERLLFVAFDAAHCDRIALRFRELMGHDATLAETGQGFGEVAERLSSPGLTGRSSNHRTQCGYGMDFIGRSGVTGLPGQGRAMTPRMGMNC
jgi:hypothetical protein